MAESLEYFEQLYQHNDDPWSYANRWYEQRKRNICLSLLTQPHYQNALELGCSNGIFSQQLAERCQALHCVDANARAVELAKKRLASHAHVKVLQHVLPHEFPQHQYDLIVISEIAYYLTQAELLKLIALSEQYLSEQGSLLICHWRYDIDGFELNGEMVHQHFKQHLPLPHYLTVNDPDFLVDLWTKTSESLAQQEGLI